MDTGTDRDDSSRRNRKAIVIGALAAALVLLYGASSFFSNPTARAAQAEPTLIPGNSACSDPGVGYGFGFRLNTVVTGPFTFTAADGVLTGGAPPDPGRSGFIGTNGATLSWSSTLRIDAVIVGTETSANLYAYPTELFGDSGLHGPVDPNGNLVDIRYIEFCYDYELNVHKTATPTFTRTLQWTIDKTVAPATWDLFTGDNGTSTYTVAVNRTGLTDSSWAVSGAITIINGAPINAVIADVNDVITGGINVPVNCGVPFPHIMSPGAELSCSYATPLPNGSFRVNTATVLASGPVGGGMATAPVNFQNPTTVVNGTVNVIDTNGLSWSFSDSGSVSYDRTFICDGDEGTHPNVATIVETGQSGTATVRVNCYALAITKDASTSFDRTWHWAIDKSADATDLPVPAGQLAEVGYTVMADASAVDGNHAVSGMIRIDNPNPSRSAQLISVADVISPDILASVACPALSVPPGGSLTCSYSATLPDGSARTNTATATQQNYTYDALGNISPVGTTDHSGSAPVVFGAPANEIDECVNVDDSRVGPLGTVCADQVPAIFSYSLSFGGFPDADVFLTCGTTSVVNTASFVAGDTGTTAGASWTVSATLGCADVCTLTQGYWKTHSQYGPAPSDDTWERLPAGADTSFFLSGQTYYEVLWTPPRGNAYYILAHQYVAASLNFLNGAAAPPEVLDAWNEATTLFETSTPDEIAALKGKNGKELRGQFIDLAGILGDYNEGLIGPGHCSEDGSSAP